jgi:hypothetical protein
LRVSDVVDVSRMLRWCPPGSISVALSSLVSLSHPLAVVVIRQNVLLQFLKKFLNCNTTAINNRLKQPVTDGALIGNGLYKPVTDRFDVCNGLF